MKQDWLLIIAETLLDDRYMGVCYTFIFLYMFDIFHN